jgi:heme-degrading monooxygenase HmoA
MYYLMMQQEVADYEKWRAVFDSMESARRSRGVRSDLILRDANNPNALTLIIEWDSHDSARSWMSDPRLRDAMKEAGVLSPPTITYLTRS